jgi:O-acetylhomoserine/O-acetylserine sulfhydrylase-like pyridoxal-dependent enzyme
MRAGTATDDGQRQRRPEWYDRLRRHAQQLGTVVSPDDAALVLRGLRTLSIRLEASTASALTIAQWLEQRSEVAKVLCPMLPGSPGMICGSAISPAAAACSALSAGAAARARRATR